VAQLTKGLGFLLLTHSLNQLFNFAAIFCSLFAKCFSFLHFLAEVAKTFIFKQIPKSNWPSTLMKSFESSLMSKMKKREMKRKEMF